MTDKIVVGGDGLIGKKHYHRLRASGQRVKYTTQNRSRNNPDSVLLDLATYAGISDLNTCERGPRSTRKIKFNFTHTNPRRPSFLTATG